MADLFHKKISTAGASPDPNKMGGDDWNDEHQAAGGLNDQVFTRDSTPARGWKWAWPLIRETGGPTTLTPAAIADGTLLARSGTTVVGDTHKADQAAGVHGSTVAATASKLMHRDAAGRSQVADPSAAADIASKGYVDGLAAVAFKAAQTTTTDVNTTTAETEVYGVDLPQNTLTTGRKLSLFLWGDALNTVSGMTVTINIKLGATTIFTDSISYAISTSRQIFGIELHTLALAANSQIHRTWIWPHGSIGGAFLFGSAVYDILASIRTAIGENSSAEDNGAGIRRLKVTVQMSIGDANHSIRTLGAEVVVFA